MPSLALLQSIDVTVPKTTPTQHAIALVFIGVFALAALVVYWRSRVWGLTPEEKQRREAARGQRLEQTPRILQYSSVALRDGVAGLQAEVDGLFDREVAPADTRSTFRGAIGEIYRSISLAWRGRVEPIPVAARRLGLLAVWVALAGAVAVSTGAVVAAITNQRQAPTLATILRDAQAGVRGAVDLVGQFPYAGTLWSLAYAYTILLADWLYQHWFVLAALLAAVAVAIVVLDYRLDDADVPDRLIQFRWLAAVVLGGGVVAIWALGTGVRLLLAQLHDVHAPGGLTIPLGGLAQAAEPVGFLAALAGTVYFVARVGPIAYARIRAGIAEAAAQNTRAVAAYLLLQRSATFLAGVGLVFGSAYAVVAFADGRLWRVVEAVVNASPATQALLGTAGLLVAVGVAYLFADAWPTITAALHAALAQKAVRVQVLTRGLPLVIVAAAYVLLYTLSQQILVALGLALVVGLVSRGVIRVASQAKYRADIESIRKRILRPEPVFVSWLAYILTVDGETVYLLDVNGRTFASDRRDEVVRDAVEVGLALATNEEPPATDTEWFADFLLESGVVDREAWEEKLDEKVREEALHCLRSEGPQVTRDRFERAVDEFTDERVRQRLHDDDLRPFLTLGGQYVALAADPHEATEEREWPSLRETSVLDWSEEYRP